MVEMDSIGSNLTNTTRWPFISAGELIQILEVHRACYVKLSGATVILAQ